MLCLGLQWSKLSSILLTFGLYFLIILRFFESKFFLSFIFRDDSWVIFQGKLLLEANFRPLSIWLKLIFGNLHWFSYILADTSYFYLICYYYYLLYLGSFFFRKFGSLRLSIFKTFFLYLILLILIEGLKF